MDLDTYIALGLDKPFIDIGGRAKEVNGRTNLEILDALDVPEDHQYNPCSEAFPAPDVPRGEIKKYRDWDGARVFAGTKRDVWVYVPEQLGAGEAAALLVCNDGLGYADPNGPVRAPAVLDTLIHAGDIPPTVGVFVMPGRVSEEDAENHYQRGFEYDSVTEDYVRFLDEDLLPFVSEQVGRDFASDPAQRTIAGISSGGICAFNAAWHRPGSFGRVLSHCGSFVSLRGGIHFPYLIKSTERKPLRVFLQSGERDANIIVGDWPLANQTMARALEFAGYEVRFVFGEGCHSLRHGGAVFADSLRWLAR